MTSKLDINNFPHIFFNVMIFCDLPTQNSLRRLSSYIKNKVDTYHCRYLQIEGYVSGGILIPRAQTLCDTEESCGFYYPMNTPLTPSWTLPLFDRNNLRWALLNTRHISLHETFLWNALAYDNLDVFAFLGPPCTTLTMRHRNDCPFLGNHVEARTTLPPNFRHLIVIPDGYSECRCKSIVDHSCAWVTLCFPDGVLLTQCKLALTVVKRCVTTLRLSVCDPDTISAFLRKIEKRERYPLLRITVFHQRPITPEEDPSFRHSWASILQIEVDDIELIWVPKPEN